MSFAPALAPLCNPSPPLGAPNRQATYWCRRTTTSIPASPPYQPGSSQATQSGQTLFSPTLWWRAEVCADRQNELPFRPPPQSFMALTGAGTLISFLRHHHHHHPHHRPLAGEYVGVFAVREGSGGSTAMSMSFGGQVENATVGGVSVPIRALHADSAFMADGKKDQFFSP